jgi:hypothetical protein
MTGKTILLAILSVVVSVGVLGVGFAPANEIPDREDKGGAVTPCSLDGVNPAYHPHIFGNPALARSYGFVKAPDGTWHVMPNCHH